MPARRKHPQTGESTLVRLTPRERTVAEWLGEDDTYAEIAVKLGLRHDTVRGHARAILRKLGVRTRHAAVATLLLAGKMLALEKTRGTEVRLTEPEPPVAASRGRMNSDRTKLRRSPSGPDFF